LTADPASTEVRIGITLSLGCFPDNGLSRKVDELLAAQSLIAPIFT
jgi:hypothetical protein